MSQTRRISATLCSVERTGLPNPSNPIQADGLASSGEASRRPHSCAKHFMYVMACVRRWPLLLGSYLSRLQLYVDVARGRGGLSPGLLRVRTARGVLCLWVQGIRFEYAVQSQGACKFRAPCLIPGAVGGVVCQQPQRVPIMNDRHPTRAKGNSELSRENYRRFCIQYQVGFAVACSNNPSAGQK